MINFVLGVTTTLSIELFILIIIGWRKFYKASIADVEPVKKTLHG